MVYDTQSEKEVFSNLIENVNPDNVAHGEKDNREVNDSAHRVLLFLSEIGLLIKN